MSKAPENTTKQKQYKYYKSSFVIGKKPDGTPDRVYVRGKTKAELNEKLNEAKRLHRIGLKIGDCTVSEWSHRWLDVCKANASDAQKAHYAAKLKYDILPVLGRMKMRDVRSSHLQEMLNAYKGGKEGTVKKVRIALRQLFEDAVVEGIIERNPAMRLELPEMTEEARRPLNIVERMALLKVAETHPQGGYVLVMLYCGLRRGECIALTCGDVDLKRKRINVNKSLNLESNIGVVTPTKAAKLRKRKARPGVENGVRSVPIPDVLLPTLLKICAEKQPEDVLFPKKDGNYATKQACRWWWESFSRQCHISAGAKLYRNAIQYETSPFGAEITPHYLRHTYATDLYAAGIDEKARKLFLGHASNDITDIYTQMSNEAFDRATTLLNEYHNFERWLFSSVR